MLDLSGLCDSNLYLIRQTNHSMIHDLRIDFTICRSPIIHLVYPPKFCITFDFNFSWVLKLSQKKLGTILKRFFLGGGRGRGCEQGILWEICKWRTHILRGSADRPWGHRINLNYQTELNSRGTQTKTRNMNGEK